MGRFSLLLGYIPQIEQSTNHNSHVFEALDAAFETAKSIPESGLPQSYMDILSDNGIKWTVGSMEDADISEADAQCILALIIGVANAERSHAGTSIRFFDNGCVLRWLKRLREIEFEEEAEICAMQREDKLSALLSASSEDILRELAYMCQLKTPNMTEAKRLLDTGVNVNEPFEADIGLYFLVSSVLLNCAVERNNTDMLAIFLAYGADPNYFDKQIDPALWDLQYTGDAFGGNPKNNNVRLRMAHMLLEHGGNPLLSLEDETLFSHVIFSLFNDSYNPKTFDYLCQFVILLIAYMKNNAETPVEILAPLDKHNLQQYRLVIIECDDHFHLRGEIRDKDGTVFVRL